MRVNCFYHQDDTPCTAWPLRKCYEGPHYTEPPRKRHRMSVIIVKGLPWHSNAERDGTWWVGYENSDAEATHIGSGEAMHVIARGRRSRAAGATHAEAVSALATFIEDAKDALEALKRHEEYGEFSE